jgi:hypothetical protein
MVSKNYSVEPRTVYRVERKILVFIFSRKIREKFSSLFAKSFHKNFCFRENFTYGTRLRIQERTVTVTGGCYLKEFLVWWKASRTQKYLQKHGRKRKFLEN